MKFHHLGKEAKGTNINFRISNKQEQDTNKYGSLVLQDRTHFIIDMHIEKYERVTTVYRAERERENIMLYKTTWFIRYILNVSCFVGQVDYYSVL